VNSVSKHWIGFAHFSRSSLSSFARVLAFLNFRARRSFRSWSRAPTKHAGLVEKWDA
jgi:hypothetical protein